MSKKLGIKCVHCGDELFSWHRHDFKRCSCGKVFIDGGDDYMRVGFDTPDDFEKVEIEEE